MKKIAFVVPYFGKLPQYTRLFFDSLKKNPSIDLLLFTDQQIDYEGENLKFYQSSFENIVKRIQEKFEFNIVCNEPYKLCDYRTAYGYIFDKELKGYDFWGYCDLDMIFGDVRKFLTDEILEKYEKVYQHGHMTLYRNTKENNMRFMQKGGMDYVQVYSTRVNCVFDEVEGIQRKYDILGVPTYKGREFADISPWHDAFKRVESYLSDAERKNFNYKEQVFYWQDGKILRAYVENGMVRGDELAYLHFQKRRMPFADSDIKMECFYITRDGIVRKTNCKLPTRDEICELNLPRPFQEIKKILEYKFFVWNRRFLKYVLKK